MTTTFSGIPVDCYCDALLRKEQASLAQSNTDRGSSCVIWTGGLFNLSIVLLALIFNTYCIIIWIIPMLMVGTVVNGLWNCAWYWPLHCGEFYTESPLMIEDTNIVGASHRIIRRTGYLGTSIMDVGGVSYQQLIVLLVITLTSFGAKFIAFAQKKKC